MLAGCNAVEDVRDETFTPIPNQQAVLAGDIFGEVNTVGVGSKRSLVLVNTVNNKVTSVLANTPVDPYPAGTIPSVAFNFGNADVGSSYNISVRQNPFGKMCTVDPATQSGVVTENGAVPKIRVTCINDPAVPHYNLTVTVPNSFVGLPGATVRLFTEDQVREIPGAAAVAAPLAGYSTVTFPNVLVNPPSTSTSGAFLYTVTAYTLEGGATIADPNRCGVSNAQNTVSPTANVGGIPTTALVGTWPTVQPCTFTIGGNIGYSQAPPPGAAAYTPQAITGLVLQLKDKLGNELEALTIPSFTPAAAALATGTANTQAYTFAYPVRSNTNGIYDIAVKTHPTGMTCVVTGSVGGGVNGSGGGVTLYQTSALVIPVSVTNQNVRCRVRPATANTLRGIYQLTSHERYSRAQNFVPTTAVTTTTNTPSVLNASGVAVSPAVRTTLVSSNQSGEATVMNIASAISNPPGCTLYYTGKTLPGAVTSIGTLTVRTAPAPTSAIPNPTPDTPGFTEVVTPNSSVTAAIPAPSGTTPAGTPGNCNYDNPRNFISFFDNGTFLYGVHSGQGFFAGTVNALEHGFYYYDPVAARIYFSIITDSTPTTAPTSFNAALAQSAPWNGLSGTPGRIVFNGFEHPVMTGVVKTPSTTVTVDGIATTSGGKMVGRFGPGGTVPVFGTGTVVNTADWTLVEPFSAATQVSGTWVSRDSREFWVYDHTSSYGYHVGVNGGSNNLQDNCFIFENFRNPTGYYAQRDVGTLNCNMISQFEFASGATIDVPSSQGTIGGVAIGLLPGFVGRMPGSIFSNGTRATSPTYYNLAPAATFFTTADPYYFPTTVPAVDLSWCTADVFGARETVNTVPFPGSPPAYFCRTRAN